MKPDKQAPVRKKATRALGPHIPADYDLSDVVSIQKLLAGAADAVEQKRALAWIINQAAGTYEFNYYPSERDTAFALGRCFVGQQIVKMTRMNVSSLRRD